MTRFEKVKKEISEMSLNDFMKFFVSDEGVKDYICSGIKVPHAHCIGHKEHDCTECIKAYLEGEASR